MNLIQSQYQSGPGPAPAGGEQQFRAIFDYSGSGMAVADTNGNLLLTNPALQRMLGYSEEELHGIQFSAISLADDVPRELELLDEVLAGKRDHYQHEKRYGRKDGSIFWARVTVTLAESDRSRLIAIVDDIQQQREMLGALRESESRYRLLVEESKQVVFYQHDSEFRITYISPSIFDLGGYSPEELIGKSLIEFLADEESIARVRAEIQAATSSLGRRPSYRIDCRHKNGTPVTVEVIESSYARPDGSVAFQGFARDVMAQKVAEERLQLSDQILQTVDAFVLVANGNGQVTYVSPSITRVLGFSASDLLGYGWWRHRGGTAEMQREACEAVAERASGRSEILADFSEQVIYDRDGIPHWVLWQDTKGPGDLLIGVGQDISKYKKINEALAKSNQQSRAIFDAALDGMFIVDNDERYLDVNPAGCRLLSRTREEIVGAELGSFTPDREKTLAIWNQIYSTGEAIGENEIRLPDGRLRSIEFAAKAHILPGVHLSVVRDVTERKTLERQLLQAQKMEAVGRLAGGVAHDFNNMLTVIRGYAELLQKKAGVDAGLYRYANGILNAADRAALTTQQLLAFSRRQVIQPQLLNLNNVVVDMGVFLQRLIGEDVRLRMSLAPDLGEVKADPGQIGQVLLNLAVNARDAMPDGGTLLIETANVQLDPNYARTHLKVAPGSYVMLTVTDSGCGMTAETITHIFEPFFTTKAAGKGTGLGLPTVYGIVELAGGAIYVYSEPGEGSSFKVYLPRSDRSQTAIQDPVPANAKERTVLLIEDDAANLAFLAEFLRGEGYTTLTARGGRDALDVCQKHRGPIHIVISDVTMPGTDGHDLQGFLVIRDPELKTIYISGFPEENLRERGLLPIECHFLQKPFPVAKLATMLEELLQCAERLSEPEPKPEGEAVP